MQATQLFEHLKILHIPRPDLDDVHFLEQIQLGQIHNFSDNGKAGFFFCFQ